MEPVETSKQPLLITVGGIRTVHVTRDRLSEIMIEDVMAARAGTQMRPRVVVASNGSVIARYHRDPAYRALVDQADIVDPDGMSLVFATRLLLRQPLLERVATTDFLVNAAAAAERHGARFFLLGAKPGVAQRAGRWLVDHYPRLQIAGARHGYFEEDEIPAICAEIRDSGTDVLWLGLGSPHQEAFAIHNRERLGGVAWIRTCGGLFDHYGADVPRAPLWMQAAGLEWLHRSMLEPRRLGTRYLASNPLALYHLLTKTR